MINPFKDVNWNPDTAEKRKFAKGLMIGFPIIAALIFLGRGIFTQTWNPTFPLKLGGLGFGAGLLFCILPILAKPFYLVWFALACCIGIVVGNVLMGGFFFIVVSGVRFLLALIGKQPILKRPDTSSKTYWRDAEKVTDAERYFRQF